MSMSESIAALAAALSKAQGEFKGVPMNAVNPFLKNRYADLGSVIETAKPVLTANGLAISQIVSGGEGSIGVTTILMHSSGEWIASSISLPVGDERGKSMAQVAGSIVTYLRRYAYASILGLYADEDADGNEQERRPGQQAQRTQPERKPEPLAQATTPPPSTATEPPAQPTNGNGNGAQPDSGKVEPASIKTTKFAPAMKQLHDRLMAEGISKYAHKKTAGGIDYDHALYSAAAEGYPQITDANLDAVIAALDKRARSTVH